MASYERFYKPDVLARIGRLELRAKMVVEGIIAGMHRSPYHGQSVEFVDHRAYVQGDDLRHLDWKVYGRADRLVLKRFEEETSLRGHIVLDCSESMRYGQGAMSKFEYGGTLAASIAYLLQRQHDSVGLTLFDSEVRATVPLSTHQITLRRIGEAMASAEATRKTQVGDVWFRLASTIPRRGLVTIISDLFAPLEEIHAGLQAFTLHGHDVIVFQVLDETELTFPFEGNTLFDGLEGYPEILVDPRTLRDAYLEVFERYLAEVEKTCATLGIDYRRCHTGEVLDAAIVSVLAARVRAGRRRF